MKKLLLVLIISCLFGFGCKKNEIEDLFGDFFSLEESEYFIFIYQDNCGACENSFPSVLRYNQRQLKNQDFLRIYIYNVSLEENKLIFRSAQADNGEANEGKTKVTGATQMEEIFVSSTPTLIKIKEEDGQKRAYLVRVGKSNIVNYLDGLK